MGQVFVGGLDLSRRFYREAVEPLLRTHFGAVPYTAALIGRGSEVLGFDTERSTDHDWGPRLQVFLTPADTRSHAEAITAVLADRLPVTFLGYPTSLVLTGEGGTRCLRAIPGPVRHAVQVSELGDWLVRHLGFDPRTAVSTFDWLATPSQKLAEITAGDVFHDGLAELGPARARLAWYPDDVWRYVLACQWQRISQEEPFPARAGEAGDDLGSAVVAARQARDLIRLCLLLHRRYPPYSKWLGTAFARLPCAADLTPVLSAARAASDWRTRERHLGAAYEIVAALHNQCDLTRPLDPAPRAFHDRPYQILDADRFATALRETITDPAIRALPPIGAIDQHVDSTDVLQQPHLTRAITAATHPTLA